MLALLSALALAACGNPGGGGTGPGSSQAVKGGTLKLLGTADVDHLDTSSAYYTATYSIERAFTRQLVSYAITSDYQQTLQVTPDVATVLPTTGNGGITDGGKTYTIHLRNGVTWDTSPARQVTAGDFVREFKLLCNPAQPAGAPSYFTSTIAGMKDYCDGFANVDATASAIKQYVDGHSLQGVTAPNDSTIVFHLLNPASDFLNILAMPFSSARPDEYMSYVPDSADLRSHTISDGPYKITSYTANKEIDLARNPHWNQSSDPLRGAYVDKMVITEGLQGQNVQQELQAGTGDVEWDVPAPFQDIPQLVASHDPNLVIGPSGSADVTINYLVMNEYTGPMKNEALRQAAEYAVNKNNIVQIYGGPKIAQPATQMILPGNTGYDAGFNPWPDKGGAGDVAKAKQLMTQAGFPNGVDVKLLYGSNDPNPKVAQSLQASLGQAGFHVTLVPAQQGDFYGNDLENLNYTKAGNWDMAIPGWIPDWMGNNGRTVLQPLFTAPGNGSTDYGGYDNSKVDDLVSKALSTASASQAGSYWQQADEQIMKDSAAVPLDVQKWPVYHASRVQNCAFDWLDLNCDLVNVWIKGS